jgi:FkbM family methyltransferase
MFYSKNKNELSVSYLPPEKKVNKMNNEALFEKLTNRIRQNEKGGFACYFRRLSLLFPIILQKMKINKEVKIPLFFGDKMNVITGEVVSSVLINFSYSETALTALMLKLILQGQVVVDIGTHFGYEALLASRLVGKNGKVISFEPNPGTYQIALKNLKKLNITLNNSAVGDYNGMVKMRNKPVTESAFNYISDESTEKDLIDVPLTTLDSTFASRERQIDFIKCDVEGFELEVLKGSVKILAEDKPILVLEAEMPPTEDNDTRRSDEIAEFLSEFGYTGYSFDLIDNNLAIDKLHGFRASHANILFVHKTKSALIALQSH